MFWKTLVVSLFVVGVFADNYTLDEDKKKQLATMLTKQCQNVNAPAGAAEELSTAVQSFVGCLTNIVNFEQIKQEIEEAKPRGALDEVFKKYCDKTPEIKTCIHTMFDASTPCLDDNTKVHINSAKNGTDQLIDFVCYKDGDRIALFISEHGPECFQEKSNVIRECANTVRGSITPEEAKAMTLPAKCAKYDDLSKCIVTALEGCSTPTPGNMAESLFKYVRKSSPCNDALPPKP